MKTNAQVCAAFIRGEAADSKSLHSDGHILRSYATPIAYHNRPVGDQPPSITVTTQKHSVTTSRHMSELWTAAHSAGYDGPAWWDVKNANAPRPFLVRVGYSDPDAPAIVWEWSQKNYENAESYREWNERRNNVDLSRHFEFTREERTA